MKKTCIFLKINDLWVWYRAEKICYTLGWGRGGGQLLLSTRGGDRVRLKNIIIDNV